MYLSKRKYEKKKSENTIKVHKVNEEDKSVNEINSKIIELKSKLKKINISSFIVLTDPYLSILVKLAINQNRLLIF